MGPIGIFVGPMVVAFLQTLLNLLHDELTSIQAGQPAAATSEKPARLKRQTVSRAPGQDPSPPVATGGTAGAVEFPSPPLYDTTASTLIWI